MSIFFAYFRVDLIIENGDFDRDRHFSSYMQKTCDVAGKAILAKINFRKKCVNRDKMYIATKVRKS